MAVLMPVAARPAPPAPGLGVATARLSAPPVAGPRCSLKAAAARRKCGVHIAADRTIAAAAAALKEQQERARQVPRPRPRDVDAVPRPMLQQLTWGEVLREVQQQDELAAEPQQPPPPSARKDQQPQRPNEPPRSQEVSPQLQRQARKEEQHAGGQEALAAPPLVELAVGVQEPACDEVVSGLAGALEQMVAMAAGEGAASPFHSATPPEISVTEYVTRLWGLFGCAPECFVLAIVYIDRVIKRNPEVVVNTLTCHRLVACSLTLAAKFHEDAFCSNAFYAGASGLPLKELNELEQEMLGLLGHRMFVLPSEFELYRRMLRRAAGAAGS